ncbi:hypothetical protein H6A24_09320 [Bacteroides caecicola]|uniref:Uncharacterized protein n=1 Tax=Bacteroides caecicola TaxID=1462569 RepID=A0ABS2F9G2_9BACE|nr:MULTISPECIES: hypothetical protein [Bacteroidaceae]MBM6806691.1 hypothetical protein [Bacteroides caecicola]MCL1625756.1 hypothetical protein [Bacteroides caecicola]
MKIGSNGCVKHCDENKANGDLETWDFAFPYSGRLITMPGQLPDAFPLLNH